VRSGIGKVQRPNKQGLFKTVRYENRQALANFKTGALNRSATLP
jgi:hypothetical protein